MVEATVEDVIEATVDETKGDEEKKEEREFEGEAERVGTEDTDPARESAREEGEEGVSFSSRGPAWWICESEGVSTFATCRGCKVVPPPVMEEREGETGDEGRTQSLFSFSSSASGAGGERVAPRGAGTPRAIFIRVCSVSSC